MNKKTNIIPGPERELRYIDAPNIKVEKRDDGKEKTYVEGTAVFFDQLSRNLGWFREKFARGAFDDVLDGDTVALFNHDMNMILARTISKTLELSTDDKGLHYRFEVPNTTAGRDLVESMNRGDVQHSSFSFTIQDEKWDEDDEAGEIRTVLKVKRLYDVAPVVFPAYPQSISEVSKRNYDQWKQEQEKKQYNDNEDDADMALISVTRNKIINS